MTTPAWDVSNSMIGLLTTVKVAPKGTALPTYTGDTLAAGFKTLGAVSDDGISITPSRETTPKKIAQSRSDVLIIPNGQSMDIKFSLVEWSNTTFNLLFASGDFAAVTSQTGEFSLDVDGDPDVDERAFYFDWAVDGTKKWGLGIPHGQVTDIGDLKVVNNDWAAVDLTIRALATDADPLFRWLSNTPGVDPA